LACAAARAAALTRALELDSPELCGTLPVTATSIPTETCCSTSKTPLSPQRK